MRYSASVIIMSDKGSRGEREDLCGPALAAMLRDAFDVKETLVIPDDAETIVRVLSEQVDGRRIDLVVTSGGTGLSPRDVTPEATTRIIERQLPGLAEIMRLESYRITPTGILSRGVCGIRKESIIVNLPGSPRAATECLGFILPALPHALDKLKGDMADCGRP